MKLNINDEIYDYKITITAEKISPFGDKIGGTKEVLSNFETMLWDVWRYYKSKELNALAEDAVTLAMSLHKELVKKGYYKEEKDNETK